MTWKISIAFTQSMKVLAIKLNVLLLTHTRRGVSTPFGLNHVCYDNSSHMLEIAQDDDPLAQMPQ